MMRIGHGYDVHAFTTGNHVMLAGVRIPADVAVLAHSDGDVILHALCDALLGAAGLGDIGEHFPDSDDSYKGIDSARLLHSTLAQLQQRHYKLGNVDITLVAQKPRVQNFKAAMRTNLATLLGCDESAVNIKATTTEKLGFLGRGEGLAAHAVVLLEAQ